MTKRAIIFCILFVLLLTTLGYINDHVLRLESTSNGHQLPIIVIGTLFMLVLCVNPILALFGRKRLLAPAELAVIVCICSCACGIGGRALMEHFSEIVTLPHYWENMNPGWKRREVLKRYPKETIVDAEDYDEVVSKFIMGSGYVSNGDERLLHKINRTLRQVPWSKWKGPLLTWGPFIFLINIAMTALALVMHRQWSEYEHLQYPIAEYASSLLKRDDNRIFPNIFSSKAFWIGLIIVLIVRLNNGLYQWYPENIIPVKMNHSFWAFTNRWPILRKNPHCWALMRLNIFPLATAIAFFLSSEMSLSIGMTQIFWAIASIFFVSYGVSVSTDYDIGGFQGWMRGGAYISYTLLLLYSGRFYYWNVLKYAFFVVRGAGDRQKYQDECAYGSVNAMRVLILSVVALCFLALRLGLPFPIAVANVILMLMIFMVVARVCAETGLFFIQPGWQPFGFILALMGGYAMGPTPLLIAGLMCCILCIDQSQNLMAYFVNGLKLAEKTKVPLPKIAGSNIAIYILGIVVCVVMGITASYELGISTADWNFRRLPTMPIRAVEPIALQLQAIGTLEESESLNVWQRLAAVRPVGSLFLGAVTLGVVGVITCHLLRMRTTWWKIHPCLFILWGTFPMNMLSWPFMLGWIIKKLSLRYGGFEFVQKMRPLAIGVIAGEVLCAFGFMVFGVIYYLETGDLPKPYSYFPR